MKETKLCRLLSPYFSSHYHASTDVCSLEVVLRAETVEQAQAGDKCDFIGTLIVVPDVSKLQMPGMSQILRVNDVGKTISTVISTVSRVIFHKHHQRYRIYP